MLLPGAPFDETSPAALERDSDGTSEARDSGGEASQPSAAVECPEARSDSWGEEVPGAERGGLPAERQGACDHPRREGIEVGGIACRYKVRSLKEAKPQQAAQPRI